MKSFIYLIVAFLMLACNDQQDFIDTEIQANIQKPAEISSVSGRLSYQDRFYSSTGFISSNTPYKPIAFVPVSLMASGELVAEAISDANGYFNFINIPEGNYDLRVHATSMHPSGFSIEIMDDSDRPYVIEQSVTISEQQNEIIFVANISDRVAGIFNILDVFSAGFDFVEAMQLNNLSPNKMRVFWQWGVTKSTYTCRARSYQCRHGAGIYILSDPYGTGDSDEFDDDVLLHEFAHYIELNLGMTDSPGGMHSLSNYSLDLRLAWSEGMASAFAIATKKWLRQNQPARLSIPDAIGRDYSNYYIDTARNTTLISVDLLTASSPNFRFTSNEAAVASGVLRLQSSAGIERTWQNLFNGLSSNVTADTFESFWEAMLGYEQPAPTQLAQWQSSLASKKIELSEDQYESNNGRTQATKLYLNEAQNHTLYFQKDSTTASADQDWFELNLNQGQHVIIETLNLTNGADTQMSLFDQNYQLIASNDDAVNCESQANGCNPLHNGSNFSSKISYTATQTARYYIRITTTDLVFSDPVNYGYIGRFGGYSIQATSQ